MREFKGRLIGTSSRGASLYELATDGYGPVRVWLRPYADIHIEFVSGILRVAENDIPSGWSGGQTGNDIIEMFDRAIRNQVEAKKEDRRLA